MVCDDFENHQNSFSKFYFLGGPFYCGAQLKSKYNVGLNSIPRFELCSKSNPAPEITYKSWYAV